MIISLLPPPTPTLTENKLSTSHAPHRPRLPARKMALRKPLTENPVQLTLTNLTPLVRDLSFPLS